MKLWQFHGGLKLNGHKSLSSESQIRRANLPPFLVLPLLQHIGEPTEAVVEIGEKVLKGQVIGHCREKNCSLKMSTPIHASSSGTVVAIENRPVPHPSGLTAPCIVIETDGEDKWIECTPIADYSTLSPTELLHHIAKAGIVGLGGAGFPAHIKLNSKSIDTLIINGAECEPYITCDDRLMREYPQDIIAGAQIIRHILGGTKRCVIAVEDNKPEAYQALSKAAEEQDVEIELIPTRYPTGGERQLIQVLTGKEIGRAELPAKRGIVVHNVKTARAVYRAIQHGRPLVSRIVTVTGEGVENPQNFEVPFGTLISFLIEECGRSKAGIEKLIMGGPMMGFGLANEEYPIIKTTNCIIASPAENIEKSPEMPCIRCGACAQVCPVNLLPQQLYWHAKAKDFKKAQNYHIFDCIDCGCCAHVCPSHIPLVSYYRYAKAEIRAISEEQKQAEIAKKRHEFRIYRVQRDKRERREKLQKMKAASNASKEAAIKAALERTKAKKEQKEPKEQVGSNE